MSVAASSRKCHLPIAGRQPTAYRDDETRPAPACPCGSWHDVRALCQCRVLRCVGRRPGNADHAEGRLRLRRGLLHGGNSFALRQLPDIRRDRGLHRDIVARAAAPRRGRGRTALHRASSAARTTPSRDDVTPSHRYYTFNVSIRENHNGSEIHHPCIGLDVRAACLLRPSARLMLRNGARMLQRRRLLHVGLPRSRPRLPPARAGGDFLFRGVSR